MSPRQAVAFVRKHGVVLEAATGPVPTLAQAIAGAAIRGSWWVHPRSREIFQLTRAVRNFDDILVCRLVDGKITYVHSRLWPSLIRAAKHFPPRRLARVSEVHTAAGRHVTKEVAFPGWVPDEVCAKASKLSEAQAVLKLGECVRSLGSSQPDPSFQRTRRKRRAGEF